MGADAQGAPSSCERGDAFGRSPGESQELPEKPRAWDDMPRGIAAPEQAVVRCRNEPRD